MGQAFRRASGKLRTTIIDTPSQYTKPFDKQLPIVLKNDKVQSQNKDSVTAEDGNLRKNDKVLEERDPSYEAMLSQMAGKIKSKTGGQLEMGEAFVVQKSKRPMPKVRNTTPDTGRYEERPVAAGTLNVAQLRHIMRMSQGKTNGHDRSLGVKEIAERFQVDVIQLETILKHVSLPPADDISKSRHDDEE